MKDLPVGQKSPVCEMLVGTRSDPQIAMARRVKRAMDISGALLLLLFCLPIFLMIAVLVRVADEGPVFYSHRRVGRDGREFGCLKFRSMRPDADAMLAAVLESDPAAQDEWRTNRKLRNDMRVTRLGRVLRATSLDELPQLLNVLRGEMSLVGPRPVTRAELDTYYTANGIAADAVYLSMRPGITGLWQISGRSDTDYRERVALDLAYARNPSLRRDLAILLRTCVVVVWRKGAR